MVKQSLLNDEKIERRDDFLSKPLEEEKQRKFIREFLISKDNKLNKDKNCDEYYSKKENRVNFLADILLVPNIKNHIYSSSDSPSSIYEKFNFLKNQNSISIPTQIYLNSLKRKYQKEKDDLENVYRKKIKQDPIDIKIEETYKRMYGETCDKIDYKAGEYGDYLQFKYEKYDSIDFSTEKERDVIMKIEVAPKKVERLMSRIFGKYMKENLNKKEEKMTLLNIEV